jgi:hypothetical protein
MSLAEVGSFLRAKGYQHVAGSVWAPHDEMFQKVMPDGSTVQLYRYSDKWQPTVRYHVKQNVYAETKLDSFTSEQLRKGLSWIEGLLRESHRCMKGYVS